MANWLWPTSFSKLHVGRASWRCEKIHLFLTNLLKICPLLLIALFIFSSGSQDSTEILKERLKICVRQCSYRNFLIRLPNHMRVFDADYESFGFKKLIKLFSLTVPNLLEHEIKYNFRFWETKYYFITFTKQMLTQFDYTTKYKLSKQ